MKLSKQNIKDLAEVTAIFIFSASLFFVMVTSYPSFETIKKSMQVLLNQ